MAPIAAPEAAPLNAPPTDDKVELSPPSCIFFEPKLLRVCPTAPASRLPAPIDCPIICALRADFCEASNFF